MAVRERQSPEAPEKSTRLRLDYLDGLRGLAALYVALHHAYYGLTAEVVLPHSIAMATYCLYLGRSGVDVFIVLSGYCLMIPVVRAGTGHLPNGVGDFFRRRARRILPPYYAAMVISLLGILFLPALKPRADALWNESLPAWTPGAILSHLFLIHNVDPAWHSKIDYPMWSVATEWQIYFLFPLILIPVWRRFGPAAALATAFIVGMLPLVFRYERFSGISPQFFCLFTLGAMAADVNFSSGLSRLRERIPWGSLSVVSAVSVTLLSFIHPHWVLCVPVKDIVVGCATASFLIYCTRFLTRQREGESLTVPFVLWLLQSRPVVSLGAFSYSLYLIHAPVIAVCQFYVRRLDVPPTTALLLMIAGGVSAALLCAYLFHLIFERPFIRKRE